MIQKNLTSKPVCKCGSKDFETVVSGRDATGRPEYRLSCRVCRTVVSVGKSTYALYRYLNSHKPSESFLKLFDLSN